MNDKKSGLWCAIAEEQQRNPGGGYCRECSNTTCPSWSKAQEYARKEKKFRKSNKN